MRVLNTESIQHILELIHLIEVHNIDVSRWPINILLPFILLIQNLADSQLLVLDGHPQFVDLLFEASDDISVLSFSLADELILHEDIA